MTVGRAGQPRGDLVEQPDRPGRGQRRIRRLGPLLPADRSRWCSSARGVVPIGYAAFAFILGVTLGVLFRRTLPAMAITLAVFAAVQITMPLWIRPHLVPPVQVTLPFTQAEPTSIGIDSVREVDFGRPGAWVLSEQHCRRVRPPGHPAPVVRRRLWILLRLRRRPR